jgi:hypothetical protein
MEIGRGRGGKKKKEKDNAETRRVHRVSREEEQETAKGKTLEGDRRKKK